MFFFISVFLFIIMIIVIILIVIRLRLSKIYKQLEELLTKTFNAHSDFELIRFTKKGYDYLLSFKSSNYYIKVIKNFSNAEICVNSKTMWQIRYNAFDNKLKILNSIEELMNLKFEDTENSKSYKLFIIYPNARSLLMYINECEMIFIKYDTDVHGANLITFNDLKENPIIIDKNVSKTKRKNTLQ